MTSRALRHAACTAVAVLAATQAAAAAPASASPRPATIPAASRFSPRAGAWRPARHLLVLARPGAGTGVRAEGRLLAADLSTALGRRVSFAVVRSGRDRPGEVLLQPRRLAPRRSRGSYALAIGRVVTISAPDSTGLFYGGRTLLQLLRGERQIGHGVILDGPRYPERGLMLDLGRRVYPLHWLKAYVLDMSYLKLNLLHLHLSDDQRWGLRLRAHPELASPGALSEAQMRELVRFAAARHVELFPEVDLPGHAGSIIRAHPEYELKAATATPPPQSPDSRKLDISNPAAVRYVDSVLGEVMSIFPGRYFDIGGDEYLTPETQPAYPQLLSDAQRQYGQNANVQDELLGFFNHVNDLARARGKILRAWNDDLGPGAVLSARSDIVAEWWTDFSPLSEPRPPTPAQLLASGHAILNGGWFPNYFTGDIGPIQGKPSPAEAYESWTVNQFCSAKANDMFLEPCLVIPAGEPRNLGATIDAWDDSDLTLQQIADGLMPRLRVLAQKTWDSPPLTSSYAAFSAMFARLGHAPGYARLAR